MTEIKTPFDAPTAQERLFQNIETIFMTAAIITLGYLFLIAILIPVATAIGAMIANIWEGIGDAGRGAFLGALISGGFAVSIFLADLNWRKKEQNRIKQEAMTRAVVRYMELVNQLEISYEVASRNLYKSKMDAVTNFEDTYIEFKKNIRKTRREIEDIAIDFDFNAFGSLEFALQYLSQFVNEIRVDPFEVFSFESGLGELHECFERARNMKIDPNVKKRCYPTRLVFLPPRIDKFKKKHGVEVDY